MTNIYKVQGLYASGRYVSHQLGAKDAHDAQQAVKEVDPRIIRITKILLLN